MILNEFGQIAYNEWAKLPERFSNFKLDVFQIMPNHMHGIILLNDNSVGTGLTPAQNGRAPNGRIDDSGNNNLDNNSDRRAGASPAPTNTKTNASVGNMWVHTNHWWQMVVWKFINPKMK